MMIFDRSYFSYDLKYLTPFFAQLAVLILLIINQCTLVCIRWLLVDYWKRYTCQYFLKGNLVTFGLWCVMSWLHLKDYLIWHSDKTGRLGDFSSPFPFYLSCLTERILNLFLIVIMMFLAHANIKCQKFSDIFFTSVVYSTKHASFRNYLYYFASGVSNNSKFPLSPFISRTFWNS